MSAQPTEGGINMWYINLRGVSPTNEKKMHCATTVAVTAGLPMAYPSVFWRSAQNPQNPKMALYGNNNNSMIYLLGFRSDRRSRMQFFFIGGRHTA